MQLSMNYIIIFHYIVLKLIYMTVSSDSICQTYQNVRCDTRDRQWPNSLRDHTIRTSNLIIRSAGVVR